MAENKPQEAKKSEEKAQQTQPAPSGGFSMPKIFDFTLLTQNKDGKGTEGKMYNYFWKMFDFRNGRTLQQV